MSVSVSVFPAPGGRPGWPAFKLDRTPRQASVVLGAAPHKMHDQGDDCDDEENVNQAAGDMEYKPTKDPCDEQDQE